MNTGIFIFQGKERTLYAKASSKKVILPDGFAYQGKKAMKDVIGNNADDSTKSVSDVNDTSMEDSDDADRSKDKDSAIDTSSVESATDSTERLNMTKEKDDTDCIIDVEASTAKEDEGWEYTVKLTPRLMMNCNGNFSGQRSTTGEWKMTCSSEVDENKEEEQSLMTSLYRNGLTEYLQV